MKQVIVADNAIGFPQAHLLYCFFLPLHLSLVIEKMDFIVKKFEEKGP